MKLLKDLSVKMHVASMVIIHQPDPDTFSLFDRLILLSKGRFLFSGEFSNLSVFYNRNYDEGLPDKYHIARDLILKASGYDVSNDDYLDYYKGIDHMVLDSSSELSFEDNISVGLSGKKRMSLTYLIVTSFIFHLSQSQQYTARDQYRKSRDEEYMRNNVQVTNCFVSKLHKSVPAKLYQCPCSSCQLYHVIHHYFYHFLAIRKT